MRQQAKGLGGSVSTSPSEALLPLQGHLGTTVAAVDRQGNLVERYQGTAFGELVNEVPRLSHLYSEEYWDQETHMTYLRARWYDTDTGRMSSSGPAPGKPSDSRTLNRYAYAHGDPVHGVDPTGEFTMLDTGVSPMLNIAITAALPTVRTVAFACAGIAGASMLPIFQEVELPGPLGVCASHTMRVQFQATRSGTTLHTEGSKVLGVPGIGVTVNAVEAKMKWIFEYRPGWWPGALESKLVGMIARMSIKLQRYPPAGTTFIGNIAREEVPYGRLQYRLDVENLRGHNLKRF